jgi:hypothetical protein
VDIDNQTVVNALYAALQESVMSGKYIVVDLSEHTWDTTTTKFNQAFSVASVVGVILPPGLIKIANTFLNKNSGRPEYPGLRSITIPPLVATINNGAFKSCSNLTRIVFEGGLIMSMSDGRFEESFVTYYNSQPIKAGVYTKSGDDWSWSALP